jgi:flavin-dependent dehydrogenase
VTRGRLALVGDAAGSMDAITGEGIALALAEAEALVEAMAAGDLGGYRRAHREIVRPPRRLTELVLLLHGRPRLRRLVMRRLSAAPELMSCFLEVKERPRLLGRRGLLRLTWAAVAGVR